jgi:hypothetical protein
MEFLGTNGVVTIGIDRGGKSCRLRWLNYLRPDLKRGAFSLEEEHLIVRLHSILGNRYKTTEPACLVLLGRRINR